MVQANKGKALTVLVDGDIGFAGLTKPQSGTTRIGSTADADTLIDELGHSLGNEWGIANPVTDSFIDTWKALNVWYEDLGLEPNEHWTDQERDGAMRYDQPNQ